MKLSTCITIIILIWAFALLATLPYGLYMKLEISDQNETLKLNESIYYCEEAWPSEYYRRVFSTVTTILQFILPFIIMAFCYVCVSIKLNDRVNSRPGAKTSKRELQDRDRKKRTNRMLMSMVAIFGISWLPLNIVNICNDFYSSINNWNLYNLIFFVAHLTAMSSTCYNPFLYAWLNENFRKEFKQVLPCFDPSRGSSLNGSERGRTYRSERNCNGNNETVQETLLSQAPTQSSKFNTSSAKTQQSVDAILLSDVGPPPTIPSVQSQDTVVLPSGILETPFDVTMPPKSSDNNGKNIKFSFENGEKVDGKFTSFILLNDGSCDQKLPEIV
jgi:neuropeptide Y receptor